MIRRYSAQDIEQWAHYSGDRNRVHFDKAFALKNGLKDIIVQGMLSLLDAKLMVSPWLNSDSSLNFYIKKPVLINTDIRLSIKDGRSKQILTVAESRDPEDICTTATILPYQPPDSLDNATRIPVSDIIIQTHLQTLKSYYPHIGCHWIILDTLLFSLCFNQRKDDYFHQQALKIARHHRYDSITTYHVAHKLFVSQRLLTSGDIDFQHFDYLIEDKDIYIDNDSAYNTFNIHVVEGDAIIFQSSIGCLTKASE
ncbi:MaoC/PaaZ C-terminal domain-containing protein [Kosakonia sp. H02]|nr:MaoC/PaaZ C-terminal domain-containing protein [Kosakonia sp. H02]